MEFDFLRNFREEIVIFCLIKQFYLFYLYNNFRNLYYKFILYNVKIFILSNKVNYLLQFYLNLFSRPVFNYLH